MSKNIFFVESYEVIPDVYRIPGGIGSNGENFGGILIQDDPVIVIGASGEEKFTRNLIELIGELKLDNKFRFYLPNITLNEIRTLDSIDSHFSEQDIDFNFFIHQNLAKKFRNLRTEYFNDVFIFDNNNQKKVISKQLPKKLEKITFINKMSSLQAQKTKILIIPFHGVHDGHTFIYSRDHKLLCTGLSLGYSPVHPRSYYADLSGSYENFLNSLSFISQAQSDLIFPAYDVPQFSSNIKNNVYEIKTILEQDQQTVLDLIPSNGIGFDDLVYQFFSLRDFDLRSYPFDAFNLGKTIIQFHLNHLLQREIISLSNQKYQKK